MICQTERKRLIAAKELHQQGVISYERLKEIATEYRSALLAHRKLTGKKFWIPDVLRLISITADRH